MFPRNRLQWILLHLTFNFVRNFYARQPRLVQYLPSTPLAERETQCRHFGQLRLFVLIFDGTETSVRGRRIPNTNVSLFR